MQLHASHSTPSLASSTLPLEARSTTAEMAGNSRQDAQFGGKAFPAQILKQELAPNGLAADADGLKSWLAPSVAIVATSVQHDSPSATTNGHVPSQAMTRQHGSSPSFPQLVSETPITPSLVPSEAFERQNSHSLFSPHDLTQVLPAEPAQVSHGELTQGVTNGLSQAGIRMSFNAATPVTNGYRHTDTHGMDRSEQEELSLRSMSLGKVFYS